MILSNSLLAIITVVFVRLSSKSNVHVLGIIRWSARIGKFYFWRIIITGWFDPRILRPCYMVAIVRSHRLFDAKTYFWNILLISSWLWNAKHRTKTSFWFIELIRLMYLTSIGWVYGRFSLLFSNYSSKRFSFNILGNNRFI